MEVIIFFAKFVFMCCVGIISILAIYGFGAFCFKTLEKVMWRFGIDIYGNKSGGR